MYLSLVKTILFFCLQNFILLEYVVVAMNFPYEVPNFFYAKSKLLHRDAAIAVSVQVVEFSGIKR